MEITKDTKVNKPSILESDLYFNSLLKSQSENLKDTPSNKIRPISLIILIIIIGAGLFFAVNYYVKATNPDVVALNTPESQNSGGYFNPDYYLNTQRNISGKIQKKQNSTDTKTMGFELIGNDGKTIAYLFSETNDLNLSAGLTAEIQGEFRTTAADGKEIIEVMSIRLK